ncbi:MAG: exodeoxyribonuclease V subunit beta [Desulfobacteraceae bacterium]|nr:MAG: exodeoxyribonuclease V subunit beta [Desulfobacteraceae bacterium]
MKENAFESRIPFELELVPNPNPFFRQVSLDFFSLRVNNLEPVFLKFLGHRGFTPEYLRDSFSRVVSARDIPVIPEPIAFTDLSGDYLEVCRQIKTLLLNEQDEIYDLVISHPDLDKRSYKKNSVRKWLDQAKQAFQESDTLPLFHMTEKGSSLYRFTRTHMQTRLKNDMTLPVHTFFDLCEQLLDVYLGFERNIIALKQAFIRFYRDAHTAQKSRTGVFYFDDLIHELSQSLGDPSGSTLISQIQKKYQACLIDEFQDTDLDQYRIFSRLFLGTARPFFMIGDPKQAIYAFRGGDIFAYLAAVKDSQASYTLALNYRSAPLLVEGVNQIFSQIANPFAFDDIPFYPVSVPDTSVNRLVDSQGLLPPFQFSFIPRADEHLDRNGYISKGAARIMIPQMVARDIASCLNSDLGLDTGNGDTRPIQCGDIAVLVRKNTQAPDIQDALSELGIPSVISKTGSVFDTEQARDMADILAAVLEPGNRGLVRTALCSSLFGFTGEALIQMDQDDSDGSRWHLFFHTLNTTWKEQGFIRMMHGLLNDPKTLLNPGSNVNLRALTNFFHLTELLHSQSVTSNLTPALLVKWFQDQIMEADKEILADELRLESDSSAVAIVTVHKSKGLEYPLVFLPYLWEGESQRADHRPVFFHDPRHSDRLTVDIGSSTLELSREQARIEALAEDTRLLYVALTRASAMCRVYWGGMNTVDTSALGRLLHPRGGFGDDLMRRDLETLVQHAPQAIQILGPDPGDMTVPFTDRRDEVKSITFKPFDRVVVPLWRISSFSGLIKEGAGTEPPSSGGEGAVLAQPPEYEPVAPHDRTDIIRLNEFPKGAGAGDFFHALFENLAFNASLEEIRELTAEQLVAHGFLSTHWLDAVSLSVQDILQTALTGAGNSFCLGDVDNRDRLNELEFHFTVTDFASAELAATLKRQAGQPVLQSYADRLSTLPPGQMSGFIKGFIDLVIRHEDRWYILDYKSNFLGDTPDHYSGDILDHAMASHHYSLQYLIYTIALHRYLAWKMPGYDYDTHFGGVFYLFIRGMSPEYPEGCGIFFDRPSIGLIKELSGVLGS